MAVFGYLNRVSGEKDKPAQDAKYYRTRIRGYAMLRNLELDKCFVELPAHSTKPFLNRRRAKKMLESVQRGDVIIAPDIEQIFCSATDAVRSIEHLQDTGVALHIAAWGDDILMQPRCDHVWPLLQFLAGAEKRIVRQRTATPKPARVQGQRRGRIPFGYTLENGSREKNRKEQEAIRFMESLKAKGRSYAAIAREVEDGLGYSFSHMGVKKILERQRKADEPKSQMELEKGK